MKPPINQQIIQGRYFMSCFLYSHSEREHKSYQKVPAPATFGPPLRLFCTTHLLPELPACMLALGGTDWGPPLGFCYQEKLNTLPVMRSGISWPWRKSPRAVRHEEVRGQKAHLPASCSRLICRLQMSPRWCHLWYPPCLWMETVDGSFGLCSCPMRGISES